MWCIGDMPVKNCKDIKSPGRLKLGYMVTVKDRVRFVETDMMGVVHHSVYFKWFEMGRVEYLRQANVLLPELMAQGIVFPIMDVSCQYKAPAKFDDQIAIETTMRDFSKVKMVFSYRIVRLPDGALLAAGETKNAFTDEDGKIKRLPEPYFARLQAFYSREKAEKRMSLTVNAEYYGQSQVKILLRGFPAGINEFFGRDYADNCRIS